jgi:hypothetical protein
VGCFNVFIYNSVYFLTCLSSLSFPSLPVDKIGHIYDLACTHYFHVTSPKNSVSAEQ